LKGPIKVHSRFHSHEDFQLSLALLRIRTLVDPSLGTACDAWEEVSAKAPRHHETSFS
jgi:hypothetical protein